MDVFFFRVLTQQLKLYIFLFLSFLYMVSVTILRFHAGDLTNGVGCFGSPPPPPATFNSLNSAFKSGCLQAKCASQAMYSQSTTVCPLCSFTIFPSGPPRHPRFLYFGYSLFSN